MKYDEDEENFLSDKRVEEKIPQDTFYRRRGGAYENNEEKRLKKFDDEQKGDIFNTIVIIIAIIVIIIAVFVMIKVFRETSSTPTNNEEDNNAVQTDNTNDNSNKNESNNKNSSSMAILSINESYNAYPLKIESVVHIKGGNFYNNNEGIKGDKVYVEYKQISGLKDEEKQKKINEMLKSLSVNLYDKNYLSDKIHYL